MTVPRRKKTTRTAKAGADSRAACNKKTCSNSKRKRPRPVAEDVAKRSFEGTGAKPKLDGGIAEQNPAEARRIKRLIQLHDQIDEAIHAVGSLSAASKRRARRFGPLGRLLRRTQGGVAELLGEFRISPMEPSEKVDYGRDDVLDAVQTPNADADGTIADVVRRGFLREGAVLRPRQVVVNRFLPATRPAQTTQPIKMEDK